jgi:hypothetical protein
MALTLNDPNAPYTIVGPSGFQDVLMYFCPNNDNGGAYSGTLRVISNAGTTPDERSLTGTEAFPIMGVNPTDIDFGSAAGTETITISNTGTGTLNWTAVETDPDGVFSLSATNGVINPGGPAFSLDVSFALAGAADTHTGSVTITATQGDAQGSPQVVTLAAETP